MQTIGQVRILIKQAKEIYIRPFFGVYEGWVKISKKEALFMLSNHKDEISMFDAFDFDHQLFIEDDMLNMG